MHKLARRMSILLISAFVAGCSDEPGVRHAGREASSYLEAALTIMERRSLVRTRVDWSDLRTKARQRARLARTPRETYPAIRQALADLGDGHSGFLTPEEAQEWARLDLSRSPPVDAEVVSGVAYVRLPRYNSGNPEECSLFATRLQARIAEIDETRPRGWILDLRFNDGGNMWPMLAGLGPLLGEGHVGSFVEASGRADMWFYGDGRATSGSGEFPVPIKGRAYRRGEPPRVAVLIGPNTASSGEAVGVAFRGLDRARFFGEPTAGRSTSNSTIKLTDGALMFLTTAHFADRKGKVYPDGITPDEIAADPREAMRRATDWLLSEP